MRKPVLLALILVIILGSTLNAAPKAEAAVIPDYTNSDADEDGHITDNGGGVYVRDTLSTYDYCSNVDHAYIQWPTTSIPDDAEILSVSITIYIQQSNAPALWSIYPITGKPQTATDENLYNDATDGAAYFAVNEAIGAGWVTYYLGNTTTDAASVDLEALLSANWFAVGVHTGSSLHWSRVQFDEGSYPPELTVRYSSAGIYYTFDAKYENGTATTVSVEALYPGGGDTIIVNGSAPDPAIYGFTVRPTAFLWITPDGKARYIYPIEDTGTIMIHQPSSTTYTYEFTIRDYSGSMGGTCYLEAYTGATLNQRMIIIASNPTPLNLELGQVYNIQVLFGDGVRFNWANFVAAASLSKTINIAEIDFDDTAHLVSQFMTVSATRTTSTNIDVYYQDERLGTVWANITIALRNGTIVYTDSSNAHVEHWAYVCLANTSYIVAVTGENTRLVEWGFTKILEAATWGFPAVPSFALLGWTLGDISLTNALATAISLAVGCVFSYRWRKVGVLAVAAFASLFTWIGFATWSYELLIVTWIVGVLAFAVVQEGN